MTCKEKLTIERPDWVDDDFYGGCCGCPNHLGYLDKPDTCECGKAITEDDCARCWDREIPETVTHEDKDKEEGRARCWDREIPETVTHEDKDKEEGRAIEIVYTDGTHDLLYGVNNFELLRDARTFKIEHVDSDIYTFIPEEHVIRIGKVWEDID